MTRRMPVLFSPRRLVSLAITLTILAIPAVVTALTAAPTCAGCRWI